jgi:hypothetical protein
VTPLTLQADFVRINKVQYKIQITCARYFDKFETILINVEHLLLFKVLAEMLLILHQSMDLDSVISEVDAVTQLVDVGRTILIRRFRC